jgi:hypothetical protein
MATFVKADYARGHHIFTWDSIPGFPTLCLIRLEDFNAAVRQQFMGQTELMFFIHVVINVTGVFIHESQLTGNYINPVDIVKFGVSVVQADNDLFREIRAGFLDLG